MTSRPRIAFVQLSLMDHASLDIATRAQGRASQRTDGPKVDLYVVGYREGTEEGVRYVKVKTPSSAFLALWQRRLFRYALLAETDIFRTYDVVVMRYVPGDLAPLVLADRSTARIVTIHHAKEAEELWMSDRPPRAQIRSLLERVQSPRFLRRVHGIVGVTDEIRDYELGKLREPKPAVTISNGVDVETVSATGFAPIGPELELAFVASASAPWHGIDRLLRGLDAYRGRLPLRVHMIGGIPGSSKVTAGGRVRLEYHGLLRGKAFEDVLARCTVGVSTLAFFRSGLRQAAVLKTRDYIARGLPFVYGYEEVDVPADAPYALRVPATEEPLDMEAVVAFAEAVSRRPDVSKDMREFAVRKLDWSVKLRQLEEFATSVA
jgi:glycosyltransferase involved in cell wall biosynthesis